MAESFFATLGKELIARSSWKNRTDARLAATPPIGDAGKISHLEAAVAAWSCS